MSDFEWVEESGLYLNRATGVWYDPATKLFFDDEKGWVPNDPGLTAAGGAQSPLVDRHTEEPVNVTHYDDESYQRGPAEAEPQPASAPSRIPEPSLAPPPVLGPDQEEEGWLAGLHQSMGEKSLIARIAWWVLLLPFALLCWGATLDSGRSRSGAYVAACFMALVWLSLALAPFASPDEDEQVSAVALESTTVAPTSSAPPSSTSLAPTVPPSTTMAATTTSTTTDDAEPYPSEACLADHEAAMAVDVMQDVPSDYNASFATCESVEEWQDAALLVGADERISIEVWVPNSCQMNPEVQGTVLCESYRAENPDAPPFLDDAGICLESHLWAIESAEGGPVDYWGTFVDCVAVDHWIAAAKQVGAQGINIDTFVVDNCANPPDEYLIEMDDRQQAVELFQLNALCVDALS